MSRRQIGNHRALAKKSTIILRIKINLNMIMYILRNFFCTLFLFCNLGMQIVCKAVIIINQLVEIVSTSGSWPRVRDPLTLSDLPIPLSLESSNLLDDSSEGFRNIHYYLVTSNVVLQYLKIKVHTWITLCALTLYNI